MNDVAKKIKEYRGKNKNALPYKTERVYRGFSDTLTFSAVRVGSLLSQENLCKLPKRLIADKLGVSPSTVWRGMKRLEDNGDIEREGGKVKFKNQDIHKRNKYAKYPEFLNKHIFVFTLNMKGEPKTYTRSLNSKELDVFKEIYTWLTSKNNTTGFYLTSYAMLAKIVGCSESTAWYAIQVLLKCGLITRTADNKGTSSAHMSAYRLNKKTLRKISQITAKKAEISKSGQDPDKYYREMRNYAEDVAEANRKTAFADPEYKRLNSLMIDKIFAEARASNAHAPADIKKKQAELKQIEQLMTARLRELGLTKEDLSPQYNCKICNDTGYIETGQRCQCYKKMFGRRR